MKESNNPNTKVEGSLKELSRDSSLESRFQIKKKKLRKEITDINEIKYIPIRLTPI